MKKVILIALVCVMVVTALAGCGGGSGEGAADDGVVGKWDVVGTVVPEGEEFEFKDDGTWIYSQDDGQDVQGNGTYEVDGDRITIYADGKKNDELVMNGNVIKREGDDSFELRKQSTTPPQAAGYVGYKR